VLTDRVLCKQLSGSMTAEPYTRRERIAGSDCNAGRARPASSGGQVTMRPRTI
jgi:hypothetical protein